MARFSAAASFFIIVVFALCSSVARSEREHDHDLLLAIRLPSDGSNRNNGDDVCAAVTVQQELCPVKCFRPDPVCGVDGVTYWCGCADAMCHGTRVAKLGYCEVGSGGSAPLPGQALLLVHIVWLLLIGFFVLFGLF